jgi:hypothetical protein
VKTRRFTPLVAFTLLAAGCSAASTHSTAASKPPAVAQPSASPTATQVQTYFITCTYDVTRDVTPIGNRRWVASQEAAGLDPATLTLNLTAISPNVPCSESLVTSGLSWAKQPSAELFQPVTASDQYAQANMVGACGGKIRGFAVSNVSSAYYTIDDSGIGWSRKMAIDTCADLTG